MLPPKSSLKIFVLLIFLPCVQLVGCRQSQSTSTGTQASSAAKNESTDLGYLSIFSVDHPQNVLSNRMEKNFARIEKKFGSKELFHFGSAGLEVYQPQGMQTAKKFTGFVNTENGASLMILTNPFSMEKTTSKIVSDAVHAGDSDILFTKEIAVDEKHGVFYATKDKRGNGFGAKYIVAFGDGDFSWIVSTTFSPKVEQEYGAELLKIVLNVHVSKKPRSPVGDDVNFTIKPNRLVLTDGFVDKLVFTLDGVFPVDNVKEPIFQAGRAIVNFEIDYLKKGNPEAIAKALISPSAAFAISFVSSQKLITIDNLDGYEFVAIGKDHVSEEPLFIYSVTLFDGEDGYVMHGWTSSDNQENYIPDFRALAKSFKRKNR